MARPKQLRGFAMFLARVVRWLTGAYGVLLLLVLGVRFGLGDRSATLFAINALSLYAFAPLPFVIVAGVVLRIPHAIATAAIGALAWTSLWGELFLPRPPLPLANKSLVVLSYNALGYNREPASTIRVIRESGADVVALQELNAETAPLIDRQLTSLYPHRWIEPRPGITGGGLLSKHPFERLDAKVLSGDWVSAPMAVVLDVRGTRVTFVRFHAFSGPAVLREREEQARKLATFAQSHRGPLIVTGDLNATDQNYAYDLIAEQLYDAWREAGFGFGHTFPGRPTVEEGGSRPLILGIPVPLWLIRIDYVFHSDHLRTSAIRLAPYHGGSDHRGVIAALTIR